MNSNDLKTIAQRLREYIRNPHHIDPVSDGFKALIDEAASALSQAAQKSAPADKGQGEPVAVVLPERKSRYPGTDSQWYQAQGWNACLDEFARLNSEPKP